MRAFLRHAFQWFFIIWFVLNLLGLIGAIVSEISIGRRRAKGIDDPGWRAARREMNWYHSDEMRQEHCRAEQKARKRRQRRVRLNRLMEYIGLPWRVFIEDD